jgi:hypothetical protein
MVSLRVGRLRYPFLSTPLDLVQGLRGDSRGACKFLMEKGSKLTRVISTIYIFRRTLWPGQQNMARPALKLDVMSEDTVEDTVLERVVKLETNVEHIMSDVAEIKTDVRRLNDKIDNVERKLTEKVDNVERKLTEKIDNVDRRLSDKIDNVDRRLSDKIDSLDQRLTSKIDALIQAVADLKLSRAFDRVWWLLMSAALLGIMGRAFKWI